VVLDGELVSLKDSLSKICNQKSFRDTVWI